MYATLRTAASAYSTHQICFASSSGFSPCFSSPPKYVAYKRSPASLYTDCKSSRRLSCLHDSIRCVTVVQCVDVWIQIAGLRHSMHAAVHMIKTDAR